MHRPYAATLRKLTATSTIGLIVVVALCVPLAANIKAQESDKKEPEKKAGSDARHKSTEELEVEKFEEANGPREKRVAQKERELAGGLKNPRIVISPDGVMRIETPVSGAE